MGLRRMTRSVFGLLLAVPGLAGCGGHEETAVDIPEDVASAAQRLMGDTSGCMTSAPMKRIVVPTNARGDSWSREDSSRRTPDCDAWDTRYVIARGPNLGAKQAFLGMTFTVPPTTEQDCLLSWHSDESWLTFSDSTTIAKAGDTAMEWFGDVCLTAGTTQVTPPIPHHPAKGPAALLWLTPAMQPGTKWYEWYAIYTDIDAIAQSFWAFWSVPSSVYLNVY